MGHIRILEDHLVNKIAAGEVVERPASVVKELVENALDAGARRVEVQLESGGRQLVRVIDDGRGMDHGDALMCIERHGTSKIRTEFDLFTVGTLGFRGEAIPSIASVSKFELITRPEDQETGLKVTLHGGRLLPPEPVGCPKGTQVSVHSLFYNLPVRRKFLRTVPTELGHCVDAVTREALIRPDVDWTVEHDGRVLLRCPAAPDLSARAADLLKDQGEALFPVSLRSGDVSVDALLSPVGVHQASAAGAMFLYVNGRHVRDATLRGAIHEAYRHIVPKGRYPVVVLSLTLPPEEVDVNVHPSKVEVRFRSGRDLFRFVADGLRDALQGHGIRRAPRPAPLPEPEDTPAAAPLPFPREAPRALTLAEPAVPYIASPRAPPASAWTPPEPLAAPRTPPPAPPVQRALPEPPAAPPPGPTAGGRAAGPAPAARPGPEALLPVPRFQDLRVIGQLADTYVLCEGAGELVIIDQHAAHERVTLHRLQQQARERLGGAQRLLTPVIVELPAARAQLLAERLDALAELNLEVEAHSGSAFAIRGVPPGLARADLPALLRDLADELARGGAALAGRDLAEAALATMACHNSIRANQALSPYEMRELLRALDGVDFEVCAHGRPVAIRVDKGELERRFHRA